MRMALRLLSGWSVVVALIPLALECLPASPEAPPKTALALSGALLVFGLLVYCRPRSLSLFDWVSSLSLRVRDDLHPATDAQETISAQRVITKLTEQPPQEQS